MPALEWCLWGKGHWTGIDWTIMIAMQPSLTVLKIETFSFSGGSTVFTYQETYTMTPHLYFNPSQLTRLTTLRPSHVSDTPKNPPNNDAQVYASIASCYFGGARSKGFATLRNVSKLPFFDKIGHAKSVGFRFYSAIWRSESRISSRYLEITSISLIYSLTFSRKKELLFWLSRGLNRLTCVTRQIRGDSKLRD